MSKPYNLVFQLQMQGVSLAQFGFGPISCSAPVAPAEHQWNGSILNCCIRCEAFQGQPSALLPCDPSKLAGKTEFCCECGDEYPASDLIAGHIYCAKCRELDFIKRRERRV